MVERLGAILDQHGIPSVYLYGSVALDDFRLGWSDIDILCLARTSLTQDEANNLVGLRQTLLQEYPRNLYFRSFEGAILSGDAFLMHKPENVVYWGTSGERIVDQYALDPFSMIELIDSGILLCGNDIRNTLTYPTSDEIIKAILNHYSIVRKYAASTGRSVRSGGWLLDIARCLYTLHTGKVISKTGAGEWAIENKLVPDIAVMQQVLEIRRNPMSFRKDTAILDWSATLGGPIQRFADVLGKELERGG